MRRDTNSQHVLAVELQPIDDLVDHLALGTQGQPHEIEITPRHRLHRGAVGLVMGGLEHVLGVERRCDIARQRPFQRARQRCAVGAVDQDRLADQRQIFCFRAVFVRRADAFVRKRTG